MKKLLILADCNIHTKTWIGILKDLFEIHLISFSPINIEGIQNYKIDSGDINQNGGNYKYLFKLNKIRKLINTIKPDIINAHYLTSYGLIAAILKGKKPLIMSLHGTDVMVTAKKNILFSLAAKYTLNKSDHIFSVSKFMTEELSKYLSTTKPLTTVQYGVDVDRIHNNSTNEKIYDFISTRDIINNSNIDKIINTFEKYVNQVDSSSKLIILATGHLFDHYKMIIKQKQLEDNIIMPGRVTHENLLEYLSQSKVFISLTSSDGAPLSLLEAMAAGPVPVVSKIPANIEWITDGVNGYTCEISAESLYQKLLLAIQSDRQAISAKAYSVVHRKGNICKNSVIIQNVFKNMTV